MATQGMVSLLDVNSSVLVKAVCGCEGYNAKKLANEIKLKKLTTARAIYDAAIKCNFGCSECLVVLGRGETLWFGDGELHPRYTETFNTPNFNPRWEIGIPGCLEIISVNHFLRTNSPVKTGKGA